jgi:dTDP-4-dehydrorhamnose 3,5-epimerase
VSEKWADMEVAGTTLDGMKTLRSAVQADGRGTFEVIWGAGEPAGVQFVQDNLIRTRRGVLRGMHFQSRRPQGKLLTVLEGEVYDAAVDLRPDSPTFGRWAGVVLKADDHQSLWLPPGLAHGFLALSERVVYLYKVTAPWDPDAAHALAWDDAAVGIAWPLAPGEEPVLSEKDRAGLSWDAVRGKVGG